MRIIFFFCYICFFFFICDALFQCIFHSLEIILSLFFSLSLVSSFLQMYIIPYTWDFWFAVSVVHAFCRCCRIFKKQNIDAMKIVHIFFFSSASRIPFYRIRSNQMKIKHDSVMTMCACFVAIDWDNVVARQYLKFLCGHFFSNISLLMADIIIKKSDSNNKNNKLITYFHSMNSRYTLSHTQAKILHAS